MQCCNDCFLTVVAFLNTANDVRERLLDRNLNIKELMRLLERFPKIHNNNLLRKTSYSSICIITLLTSS